MAHGIVQTRSGFVIGDGHMQFVQIVIEKEKWFCVRCAVWLAFSTFFYFCCQVGLPYKRGYLLCSLSPSAILGGGGYKSGFASTSSDDKTGGFLRSIRSKIVNLQMKYRPVVLLFMCDARWLSVV